MADAAEREWDRVTRERQEDAARAGARRLERQALVARGLASQAFMFDGLADDAARIARTLRRRALRAERAVPRKSESQAG